MQSRRLPGKVLMPLAGRPILQFLLERIRFAKSLDQIVVATGDMPANQPIIELSRLMGVNCIVGSEENVLDRFIYAAQKVKAEVIVRVTADNPLTDPGAIDALVDKRTTTGADLAVAHDLIDGAESEVMTFQALLRAQRTATTVAHREHVTSVMKEHHSLFSIQTWLPPEEMRRPDLSVTIDTREDLIRIRSLCNNVAVHAGIQTWTGIVTWLNSYKRRHDGLDTWVRDLSGRIRKNDLE